MKKALLTLSFLSLVLQTEAQQQKNNSRLTNPILFVTQVPVISDFCIGATFGNHTTSAKQAPRGGDLWIFYPDGSLRNLTKEAGYGSSDPTGFQGADAIAVREPAVSWDGKKAIFSMIIGNPTKQYEVITKYWQLYEITGLEKGGTAVITKVPNQPTNYSNVSPIYGSDGRIIFTSDRPFNGAAHLYPQLDEYETNATVSGLWSLDPGNGDLKLLDHSPSGDFSPTIDSYGRVIFTRWDHMITDGITNQDYNDSTSVYKRANSVNFADETANSTYKDVVLKKGVPDIELFPEQQASRMDLLEAGQNHHAMNQFFPWHVNQDGSNLETVNHIGRHEILGYFEYSRTDDPNLTIVAQTGKLRTGMFQMREDPNTPGTYYGVDAPEFGYHSSGHILRLTNAKVNPGGSFSNADNIGLEYITDPAMNALKGYRNPIPLTSGEILAVHSIYEDEDVKTGQSKYDFRLRLLKKQGPLYVADLTTGVSMATKSLNYWDPDYKVTLTNIQLWELDPVEVVARTIPPANPLQSEFGAPEAAAIANAGVDEASLRAYLKQQGLAIIVSRNVTSRDGHDTQQPYNLRVTDKDGNYTAGNAMKAPKTGKVYDVSHMQILQGDAIRGYKGYGKPADMTNVIPRAGRRTLAQPMHDDKQLNIPLTASEPKGSVRLGTDGSMAAIVPANRALSWQLTDKAGKGVVRERYWLTMQPGEIVTCYSCHGINSNDQEGQGKPTNTPQALTDLLNHIKPLVTGSRNIYAQESRLILAPNPANAESTVKLQLREGGNTRLILLNGMGQQIKVLHDGPLTSGSHQISLKTGDLNSGIYFVKMTQGGNTWIEKLAKL